MAAGVTSVNLIYQNHNRKDIHKCIQVYKYVQIVTSMCFSFHHEVPPLEQSWCWFDFLQPDRATLLGHNKLRFQFVIPGMKCPDTS